MTDYNRIREIAKRKGVSWSFLSQLLGHSRFYLNSCEQSGKDLSDPQIEKIAETLGVTASYLRGSDVPDNKPMTEVDLVILLDRFRNRPECQLLFSTLKDASAADVKKAVVIIDALKKANE